MWGSEKVNFNTNTAITIHVITTPVYDYNVVSGVYCWVIDGLILALKDWCDPFGTLEGVLPFRVEYVPVE